MCFLYLLQSTTAAMDNAKMPTTTPVAMAATLLVPETEKRFS